MPPKKSVHFIGIGGIGMSALARYFLALRANPEFIEGLALPTRHSLAKAGSRAAGRAPNRALSGSDIVESTITRKLRKEGLKVQIGHKKGHISGQIGLVIHSQAIKPDNLELKEAKRLGIEVLPYPEMVGRLTEKYMTIAVAGSHGKSTTTALAGLILKKAGLDPTIIVGTELKELGGKNFRMGHVRRRDNNHKNDHDNNNGFLVLEADEFGRAFLHYSPAVAVITNIDREHLDIYKNLAGAQKAFLKFMARVSDGGALILNKDNAPLASLAAKIKKIARDHKLRVLWYSIHGNTAKKIARVIKIPGIHNISNAVAAYKVARVLGVPHKTILSAIGAYRGASRRFEYRGTCHMSHVTCHIYDDYAHHPTEIKVTLQGFREKFPNSRLICVFQPHQAKRLAVLFKEFQSAFDLADVTLIMPIYRVAGRDEKIINGRDSEALVRAIQKKHPKKLVFYLSDSKNLKSALKTLLSQAFRAQSSELRAIVIMMGAGDIVRYTDLLLR